MKITDVKEGVMYYAEYLDGPSAIIRAEHDGKFTSSPGVYLSNSNRENKFWNSNGWSCERNIRLATSDEINLFHKSMKLGHVPEIEKIINTYLLY